MRRITTASGLALLYASAYFLPFLNPYSLYFIPSFFSYIVLPPLISVFLLTPVFLLCSNSSVSARRRRSLVFCGATVLTIIAVKSIFEAAGYSWINLLTLLATASQPEASHDSRWGRIILVGLAFTAALIFVYSIRDSLSKLISFLSILGYTFLFLSIYRCLAADLVFRGADEYAPLAIAAAPTSTEASRRVVWVIFDELDYALSLGKDAGLESRLPNFSRLAAHAVSATDAYSPGRDTLYSIPALLTGSAISGMTIAPYNKLNLLDQQGRTLPFGTQNSLFARLPGGPQSASVLGFYHPYCKVFPTLQACHSTYLGNAGRWFDSLTFFSDAIFSILRRLKWSAQYMPEFLLFQFDPMYRVSRNELARLDATLANRRSSLDFIHLNLPHLPNVYVQRLMRQPAGNDTNAYRQNLAGADMVLGRIVRDLESQAKQQNILLIVSSDHWLRTHSKRPASVPFMVWNVGASEGQAVPQPLSTVHSAELALDFLNGKLNSQAEIADRLGRATYYQTWSAPDGYKY
jgi:hypothetical protein